MPKASKATIIFFSKVFISKSFFTQNVFGVAYVFQTTLGKGFIILLNPMYGNYHNFADLHWYKPCQAILWQLYNFGGRLDQTRT